MFRTLAAVAAIGFPILVLVNVAVAQDKSARNHIEEAGPYLHLSCEALVHEYGEDEKKMEEIVELMVAVSFINREIDATKLLPDEKAQAGFGEFLEKALTTQCKNDVHSLMVTNVDRAVVYAFEDRPDE